MSLLLLDNVYATLAKSDENEEANQKCSKSFPFWEAGGLAQSLL